MLSTRSVAVLSLLLLAFGFDCQASPLHDAAVNNDIITLKQLIDSKQYDINGLNAAGQTPLAAAFSTCSECLLSAVSVSVWHWLTVLQQCDSLEA